MTKTISKEKAKEHRDGMNTAWGRKEPVRVRDMEYGVAYVGTPVGEFYIDEDKPGFVLWMRWDGVCQYITPHPDQIFFKKD